MPCRAGALPLAGQHSRGLAQRCHGGREQQRQLLRRAGSGRWRRERRLRTEAAAQTSGAFAGAEAPPPRRLPSRAGSAKVVGAAAQKQHLPAPGSSRLASGSLPTPPWPRPQPRREAAPGESQLPRRPYFLLAPVTPAGGRGAARAPAGASAGAVQPCKDGRGRHCRRGTGRGEGGATPLQEILPRSPAPASLRASLMFHQERGGEALTCVMRLRLPLFPWERSGVEGGGVKVMEESWTVRRQGFPGLESHLCLHNDCCSLGSLGSKEFGSCW